MVSKLWLTSILTANRVFSQNNELCQLKFDLGKLLIFTYYSLTIDLCEIRETMSTLACIKRDDQTHEQQNETSPVSEGHRKRRRAYVTVWYLIKASFMNDHVLITSGTLSPISPWLFDFLDYCQCSVAFVTNTTKCIFFIATLLLSVTNNTVT